MSIDREVLSHTSKAQEQETMDKRKRLQDELDNAFTLKQVCEVFGVCPMTIHHWRRDKDLPVLVIRGDGRDAIRVLPEDLREWAKKHGKVMRRTTAS